MMKRLTFPFFNAVVGMFPGVLIGYYISQLWSSILVGALGGGLLGLAVEALLGRLGEGHWLYQRRALLVILVEIPLVIFLIGPYAYVLARARPDHHTVCCETPLHYGAQRYEDFQVVTTDGIRLSGWFVPPRVTPGAVIVLLHGARGDRRGTVWYAYQLIQAGYGVVMYDQRALGESSGEMVTFGWDGPDLLAILDALAMRPEVDARRIGVVGLSGGGHIALNAAYLQPERIAALWLDGVQAQGMDDFPKAENIGESFATLINALILKMAEFHMGSPAPSAFVQILIEVRQPKMMMVAAGRDDFERRANQKYAAVAGPNIQFWFIEEAGHVGGPHLIPDEYSLKMLAFFEESLKR